MTILWADRTRRGHLVWSPAMNGAYVGMTR